MTAREGYIYIDHHPRYSLGTGAGAAGEGAGTVCGRLEQVSRFGGVRAHHVRVGGASASRRRRAREVTRVRERLNREPTDRVGIRAPCIILLLLFYTLGMIAKKEGKEKRGKEKKK